MLWMLHGLLPFERSVCARHQCSMAAPPARRLPKEGDGELTSPVGRKARTPVLAGILALAVVFSGPSGSLAASVVSPRDGDQVSSRPAFQFDFLRGVARVEWSRSPDLNTAGDEVGAFVDPDGSLFELLYDHVPLDGLARAESRLNSGLYYWHAKMRDDGTEPFSGTETPWTPVATMFVAAEPPIFEGWTMKAERLKRRGKCDRVRLRGVVKASDNEDPVRLRLTLNVTAGDRLLRSSGQLTDVPFGSAGYDRTICTRASRLIVRPAVVDADGAVGRGTLRRATVRSTVLP